VGKGRELSALDLLFILLVLIHLTELVSLTIIELVLFLFARITLMLDVLRHHTTLHLLWPKVPRVAPSTIFSLFVSVLLFLFLQGPFFLLTSTGAR